MASLTGGHYESVRMPTQAQVHRAEGGARPKTGIANQNFAGADHIRYLAPDMVQFTKCAPRAQENPNYI